MAATEQPVKKEFESRWGVILSKQVILTLRDYAQPIRGIMSCEMRKDAKDVAESIFRIGRITFSIDEVLSIVAEVNPRLST